MKFKLSLVIFSVLVSVVVFAGQQPAESQSNKITNINKDLEASKHVDTIILGAGCFWGAEKRYEAIPGVIDAVSGYANGKVKPTYQEIIKRKHKFNPENHAEVVKVTYDSSKVSLRQILENYFEGHDPTQLNRQGNDIGTQYRSTILVNSEEQRQVAIKTRDDYQELLSAADYGNIVTKIESLEAFHRAEEYHQDYLKKNPNGYCPDHSTGIRFAKSNQDKTMPSNEKLLTGKHILVIDSEAFCPYCLKFKKDVINDYQGDIPLTLRYANQLKGLSLSTPTWATPTIIFLENGKEVFGRQGYMSSSDFYRALGKFKLGKSEAFDVAFNQGTDQRFCKQYDIFKNTPDGVFIDKLSGAAVFDTRDRFNSGSGWLSFTKPVNNAVIERPDNSYGMKRTEILSASSGIHLGHVFDDGPQGQRRYCINASVLDFLPREDYQNRIAKN